MSENTIQAESAEPPAANLRVPGVRLWPAAVLVLMAVIWFSPILNLSGGWWRSHTLWSDPLRALAVVEAWRSGLWDARWFEGFDYGYGYPFLSYYAPLFHWLSGLWTLILPSASVAVRVNLFCWLAFGTAGMYLAGERLWDFLTNGKAAVFRPGLICAIGWLMSPYPMCNVFVRGALPEFASSQTISWVVWAALGVLARPELWRRRDSAELLLMVLFVALGILSHNFIGLCVFGIAFAMLPVAFLLRWPDAKGAAEKRSIVLIRTGMWAVGLIWALTATVFYWLPALRETEFVRIGILKEKYYAYFNHYVYPSNLLNVFYWNFGLSAPGANDPMPLHLGIVSLLGLASVIAALTISKQRRGSKVIAGISALVAVTVAGIVLTMPVSGFLWDHLSLLQFAQFPWRLLNIPTVGICLLLPAGVVATNPVRHRLTIAAVYAALVLCFALSHDLYARTREDLPFNENVKPENWYHLRIVTTNLDEYGPIWRDLSRPAKWPRGMPLTTDTLKVATYDNERNRVEASLRNASGSSQAMIITWNYFPGWKGRLEPGNKPLAISPDPQTGFIRIEGIPPGASRIHIWFGDTPIRRTCKIVSGIAWLLWAGGWIALTGGSLPGSER
jgi:hypothetical protein